MFKYLIFIFIAIFSLSACSGGGGKGFVKEIPDSILDMEDPVIEIEEATMESIVQNVASPVEMAALIKSLDIPYSKDFIAPTNQVDKYASSHAKALNLGIFGADLGYINMYNRTGSVVDYITAIKRLADGINVGQFFDFQTLKRLSSNSSNIDSLMYISVNSFNKMDNYLRKNQRGNLSALMIGGVWIEGLYLGTQVCKSAPSEKLIQTIGEQKTILNQLMIILDIYKKDPFIAGIIKEFKYIKSEFDNIRISIEMGEPEAVVKDGKLTIIQHEKSIVHISDEQLQNIIRKTAEVREKLINLK